MEAFPTEIPDVLLIKPRVFRDSRGHFLELFQSQRYQDLGIDATFVQDNLSRSSRGVLRGLHYQLTYPQGKLVSVVQGAVFDVAVDLRQDSPTFGKWVGELLSDENNYQLYVPPGFAHGFCVVSETADFVYKCTEYYHPEDEHVLSCFEPELAIPWPLENLILSERDKHGTRFDESATYVR